MLFVATPTELTELARAASHLGIRVTRVHDYCVVRSTETRSSQHEYKQVPHFVASAPLLTEFKRSARSWRGSVHFGLMLSGGARIHSASFRDLLAGCCGHEKPEPVIGGDMEGVGMISASRPESPNWIVVKAISDFADHRRDQVIATNRQPACYNASRFVLDTISARGTR